MLFLHLHCGLDGSSCFLTFSVHTHTHTHSGGGFSGFYYHLGFLHGLLDDQQENNSTDTTSTYYCYSSGCLGLVLAPYNIHDIWDAAVTAQREWLAGRLSRYDVVVHFLHALDLQHTPDHVRILVTDQPNGVRVEQPANVTHLVQLLVQTTAIPWITMPLWPSSSSSNNLESVVLDGGFSRWLHPECSETVHVPTTLATTLHTFNMALDQTTAWSLYDRGLRDAANNNNNKKYGSRSTTAASSTTTRMVAEQPEESCGKSNSSKSPCSKSGSRIQSFTTTSTTSSLVGDHSGALVG